MFSSEFFDSNACDTILSLKEGKFVGAEIDGDGITESAKLKSTNLL